METIRGSVIAGQFQVLRKLGEGGMGQVFLAEQLGVGRRVVIKVVHAHLLSGDGAIKERLLREARALAQLNHPNIVQLYTCGAVDGGQPYFAMEFVDGRSLSEELARVGRMDVARVLAIGAAIADAMAHAHAAGIVHRDLKPDNVMLAARDGVADLVKVLDFGIAKLTQQSVTSLTHTHASFGTPRYVAPEQATGQPVTGATDIYALGVMLFEMLTGAALFEGETPFALVSQHVTAAPRPPSVLAPGVPPRLDAAVLRCLEKDPTARFESAAALAVELRAIGMANPRSRTAVLPEAGSGISAAGRPGQTARLPDAIAPARTQHMPEAQPAAGPPFVAAVGSSSIPAVPLVVSPKRLPGRLYRVVMTMGILGIIAAAVGLNPFLRPLLSRGYATAARQVRKTVASTTTTSPSAANGNANANTTAAADLRGAIDVCLNRNSERAWESYHRYLSWVDPAVGPVAGRSLVYGVYTLNHVPVCVDEGHGADTGTPGGAAVARFAQALQRLDERTSEANRYYEADDWKDDKMAKGKAMHAGLMAAFRAFAQADGELRRLVDRQTEERDRALMAKETAANKDAAGNLARLRLNSRALIRGANVPWRQLNTVDAADFDRHLAGIAETAARLRPNESDVGEKARAFIEAAHHMRRRLGGDPKWNTGERMNLRNTLSQWMVKGSPAQLVGAYNDLVKAMNEASSDIEALAVHVEIAS